MKRLRLLLSAFTVLMVVVLACAPNKKMLRDDDGAEQADSIIGDSVPQPLVSTIIAPVQIDAHYLQRLINDQIQSLVYETDTFTLPPFKNVDLKVWRTDSISLEVNGNELSYTVPLRLWLRITLKVEKFGLSYSQKHDIQGDVAVHYRTRFSINNDWSIATATRADGYEWISEPVTKIGMLSIPITPVADRVMKQQQAIFAHLIDRAVTQNLSPRRLIMPVWIALQQPRCISDTIDMWLKLRPRKIAITQPAGSQGAIRTTVCITSLAEAFFGTPPEAAADSALPDLEIVSTIDSSFAINVYCDLPFLTADSMAMRMLAGHPIPYKKMKLNVNELQMGNFEGMLVMRTIVSGDFAGTINLVGTPELNPKKMLLTIRNLNFDLETRDRVQRAANWLMHGRIAQRIAQKLQFPLAAKLTEAKVLLQNALAEMRISDAATIKGTVDSLTVGGVAMSDTSFVVTVFAKGRMNAIIADPLSQL